MANTFKLQQTTTQIQDLLNLLLANSHKGDGKFILVSDGNGGVKFKEGIHSASSNSFIIIDNDNAISINTAALKTALNIPATDDLENVSNKVQEIADNPYLSDQYPSAAAVRNYLTANLALQTKTNYSSVNAIKTAFTNKQFLSNILYITTVTIDSKPEPCIVLQAGNIQTAGSSVSLILLYKNVWHQIAGTVATGAKSISISIDNAYTLGDMATKEYVQTYVDELITGALSGEY